MQKPLILIYSRRPPLQGDLPERLADCFSTVLCEELDDVRRIWKSQQPVGLLLDLAGVSRSGELERAVIDDIDRAANHPLVLILAPDLWPESLARRLREVHWPTLPARSPMADVAAAMRKQFEQTTIEDAPRGNVNAEFRSGMRTDREPRMQSKPGTDGQVSQPPPTAPPRLPATQADSTRSLAALEGISRRFETRSAHLAEMLRDLEVAARHDVTVLLIGETGAGKTFLSRLIHEVSPRAGEPFLTVACGALPADLIESELFGHVKGSFTGAHADKEGKFVAAGKGTILLDEIDVLGLEQQVKLLRVIETGEFEPVGSNETLRSGARLVVASNLNLQPLVQEGRFRPDLYYRLNMLKFDVPPLRQRREDIEWLARRFIERLAEKHGVKIHRVDSGLIEALRLYPWPGNVRELENVIQRAVIYCRDGILSAQQLPSYIVAGHVGPTNDPSVRLTSEPSSNLLEDRIALSEREIIEQTLHRNNFSRNNTARDLGISRVTLYNKMKKYGMMN